MKAAYRILAVVPLVGLWAAAQDDPARLETVIQTRLGDLKQARVMGIGGAVMGPAVKNAPYTAVEVTESTQVLGDGNRIHRLIIQAWILVVGLDACDRNQLDFHSFSWD